MVRFHLSPPNDPKSRERRRSIYFREAYEVFIFTTDFRKGISIEELKRDLDEHRLSAHGITDILLERRQITPEQAQQRKDVWDKEHSYK